MFQNGCANKLNKLDKHKLDKESKLDIHCFAVYFHCFNKTSENRHYFVQLFKLKLSSTVA